MKTLLPILLLAAVVAAAVVWDRPQEPADFVFVNRGEVHTLDPQRMSWMQDFRKAVALYEGLVRVDNDTFDILPGVAERWDVSPDGLTYVFHLRPEARWSNGDPVTAEDFIYSWRRGLLPDTTADYADLFFKIRGGQAFFEWRAEQLEEYAGRVGSLSAAQRREAVTRLHDEMLERFGAMVGLDAPDPHTLILSLEAPTPYMLELLAFGTFMPIHPRTLERFTSLDPDTGMIRQRHGWTKPPHLVGNGPYVLTLWRYKRDLRLERNPYYWNPSMVRSDTLLCLSIEDANTAVLAFETGTIDWLTSVNVEYAPEMLDQARRYRERHAERIAELEAQGLDYDEVLATLALESPPRRGERNNIHAFPAYGTYFYNFNCRPTLNTGAANPFHDARVRRAFARSIDKEAIVRSVTRLNQPIAHVLIPPGSIPGFKGAEGIGYDPDEGRRELAAAGWSDRSGDGLVTDDDGRPFPTVEILFPSAAEHRAIAQAVASMWERELGVRVRLREEETRVAAEHVKTHNFMVSRANWFGDYGDPTTFLDINRSYNGNNDRGYANPEFDALMERADAETDPAKRMRLLEEADALIVNEELPYVALFHQVVVYLYDPARVRGMSRHPRMVQHLHRMEVAP